VWCWRSPHSRTSRSVRVAAPDRDSPDSISHRRLAFASVGRVARFTKPAQHPDGSGRGPIPCGRQRSRQGGSWARAAGAPTAVGLAAKQSRTPPHPGPDSPGVRPASQLATLTSTVWLPSIIDDHGSWPGGRVAAEMTADGAEPAPAGGMAVAGERRWSLDAGRWAVLRTAPCVRYLEVADDRMGGPVVGPSSRRASSTTGIRRFRRPAGVCAARS